MDNFEFISPTKIYFGRGQEAKVGQVLKDAGYHKILLHYGKRSIIESGLYERIVKSLEDSGLSYVSLGGVEANPKISLVRNGVKIAKEEHVDAVLAVGGGSVIDSAKLIAVGALTDIDPWQFSLHNATATDILPLAVVLTISAAGSELSNSCVISNEETKQKRGFNTNLIRPKYAFMNPELTYTVSKYQTACGIVDIIMHTLERYLTVEEANLTNSIAEGLMKSVMQNGLIAIKDPTNYEARANLMLASSLSHNGLTGLGVNMFFTVHKIEHEVSGFYDRVAHGAGLAVLFPAWARFMCQYDCKKLATFARNVMNVTSTNSDYDDALKGIDLLEDYFKSLDMPTSFNDLGIDDELFEEMALSATDGGKKLVLGIKNLSKDDIIEVYKKAYKK